ncbi:hypothetical protein V8F06_012069 [Rhypophila decipiens]
MEPQIRNRTFESTVDLLRSAWPFGEFNHSPARSRICKSLVPQISHLHSLFQNSETFRGAWRSLDSIFMDLNWYYTERCNLDQSLNIPKKVEEIQDAISYPDKRAMTAGDVHGCLHPIAIVTNDTKSALTHGRAKIPIFEKLDPNRELAESLKRTGMNEADREPEVSYGQSAGETLASDVLVSHLAYWDQQFGVMDTESHK